MHIRSPKFVLSLTLIAVFVTGCETLDPYTREEKTSKATKGALIGAAAGAVVGLISGDDAVERRQRALILAGVGALGKCAAAVAMKKMGVHRSRERDLVSSFALDPENPGQVIELPEQERSIIVQS